MKAELIVVYKEAAFGIRRDFLGTKRCNVL
jgi:hypothetical protein